METQRLIDALRRPGAYPHAVREVGFLQTHISLLFFAGNRVYKVKKPVELGFLDYSTPERRRHFCEEEVRLNRRLAPEVYLGVVAIRRAPEGGLRIEGEGETVEHAVEMVRLPEERMLASRLERGEISNREMDEIARLLFRFHASAATGEGVDEHGSPEAVGHNVRENFEQTAAFVAPRGERAPSGSRTVSPRLHGFIAARAEGFLGSRRRLLERRVRRGRIRDGHGDLHAGNICWTDSRIVVYDCIEFAARFRCGDVASDVAFLSMDLDARGFRGFSGFMLRRYAEEAADAELGEVAGFYKAYRAVVRAKVASIKSADGSVGGADREDARLEAMRYWQLAASYELPCALILLCGLPATGKSWAARALARPFEAALLRSDVRRKLLAGEPPGARHREGYGRGLYAPESKDRTYASLLEEARKALRSGRCAVVDASFPTAARRGPFRSLARELGAPFALVHVTAQESVVRRRLAERERDTTEPSDADLEVYLRARAEFEPPVELAPAERVEWTSASSPAEELAEEVIERIAAEVGHTVSDTE